MRRMIALLLAAILLVGSFDITAAAENSTQQQSGTGGMDQTSYLRMEMGTEAGELRIYNTVTGTEYSTTAPQEDLEAVKGPIKLKLQSLVTGSYYDLEVKKETEFYTSSDDIAVETMKGQGGKLRLEYTLNNGLSFAVEAAMEDGLLRIRIPADSIRETERFVFMQFTLAPNLFSAGASSKGYLMIPDGSGALMHFNNGKSGMYDEPVYGTNKAFIYEAYAVAKETIHLPVFGMERDGVSALGVISQGAATARIKAATNGNETLRNRIYPMFVLRERDEQHITEDAFQTVIQEKLLTSSDLEVTYLFGTEGGGYSEMADLFRDYLAASGMEPAEEAAVNNCVLLSIYGAVSRKQKLLGVPLYDKASQITSAGAAKQMAEEISGILDTSLTICLAFWDADTVMGYAVNSFQPVGGKRELSSLLEDFSKSGAEVYLSEPMARISRSGKGIRLKKHVIRNLANELSVQFEYYRASNSAVFHQRNRYLLDSAFISGQVEKLLSSIEEYSFSGLALEDISGMCYANYRKGEESGKDATTAGFTDAMQMMAESYPLLLNAGYYYSFPYGRMIYNAPMGSSGLDFADEEIPFYQMALSGILPYAGTPVNQEENRRNALLKALETGSYLHYELAEETDVLKGSDLEDLYGAQWGLTAETVKTELMELEPFLKLVAGSTIDRHEILRENVNRTWYKNGWVVTVNYNTEAVTVDGKSIEGMSYLMERGKAG